jgi:plastocyanin
MKKLLLLTVVILLSNFSFATNHTVNTQGMTFVPQSITITAGDSVTFINTGGFHNVNGTTATFPSNPAGFSNPTGVTSGWTYVHLFTTPGTYNYQCDPHIPGMVGTIIVLPSSSPTITSITITDPLCNGGFTGSVDITINQSTPPIGLAVKLFWQNPSNGFWVNLGTSYSNSPSFIDSLGFGNLGAGDYRVDLIDDATGVLIEDDFFTLVNPPPLLIDTLITTPESSNGAFDGSADVVVSGGVSPYNVTNGSLVFPTNGTFTWTSLAAGIFCLTITDNNSCSITTCDTIGLSQQTYGCTDSLACNYDPLAVIDDSSCVYYSLGATAITNHVSCFGDCDGLITVIVQGGAPTSTGPYSYLWDDVLIQNTQTAIGLCAGVYTCIVTDTNGCSVIDSFTVTQPDELIATIQTITPIACNGGTGNLEVSTQGGTPPYSFLWATGSTSNTALNLSVGTHIVTVTDANGCSDTAHYYLDEPDVLEILTTNILVSDVLCKGDSTGAIEVTATGGTPIPGIPPTWTYVLSPSTSTIVDDIATFTGLATGTYSVNVTDYNGCSYTTANIFVSEPSNPLTITVDSTNETSILNDGSATANTLGGTPPYTFLWSNSLLTNPATNLAPGLYTIEVWDANGCYITDSTTVNAYTSTSVINIKNINKTLMKITDLLGRETKQTNQPLFYIYDDGTVERKLFLY